jgi:hypothetical protein
MLPQKNINTPAVIGVIVIGVIAVIDRRVRFCIFMQSGLRRPDEWFTVSNPRLYRN